MLAIHVQSSITASVVDQVPKEFTIGPMVYSFARIGAAEGRYMQNRQIWVRLHEKGGKVSRLNGVTLGAAHRDLTRPDFRRSSSVKRLEPA